MKKIILALFALSFLFANNPNKKPSDSVVAEINGVVIKKSALEKEAQKAISNTYFHSSVPDEKLKELEVEALEKLINKILIFQHATNIGIKASKNEIKDLEKNIIKNFKSKEYFYKALEESNLNYEGFLKEIEKDIIVNKFFEKHIKTELSDSDLKKYYEKNKYKFKEPEKVKLRLIYIKNDPTKKDGKKLAKERAKEAYEKIKKGENFADIASKYSNHDTRIFGGDMGFVHQGRLDPQLEKITNGLDINQTSDLIEQDIGYFILKVEEKKEPSLLPFDLVKTGLKKELIEKAEKEKIEKLIKKLTKEAQIKKY